MILNDIVRALTPHARRVPHLAPPIPTDPVPRDPLWDRIEQEHQDASRRLTLAERVYAAKGALHGGDWEPE